MYHEFMADAAFSIAPLTHVGPVSLTVADLDRSTAFYTEAIGLDEISRADGVAMFGIGGRVLLELHEVKNATQPRGTTGLYHFAILSPSRADLAAALVRVAQARYPLHGASDHLVSEALYLNDPDGNGIEIYRDRPRSEWEISDGEIVMTLDPLDLQALLDDAEQAPKMAPGTVMGHVHLHVRDIAEAKDFYHGLLGFDVTFTGVPSALFVSAGGYHHHLGLNTWNGENAPPPPPGSVGLRHFTVVLPSIADLAAVSARLRSAGVGVEEFDAGVLTKDPSQNGILLKAEPQWSSSTNLRRASSLRSHRLSSSAM